MWQIEGTEEERRRQMDRVFMIRQRREEREEIGG